MKLKLSLIVLCTAAGCVEEQTLLELSSTNITSTGGTAISADGRAKLTFPPGALATPTDITILVRRESRSDLISWIYELGPSGLAFGQDVELAIRVDRLPEGRAMLANVDQPQSIPLAHTRLDRGEMIARGPLEHFSSYGCFDVPCTSDADCAPSETCVAGICTAAPAPACGDGIVDSGEACDDGNTTSGDGCSDACMIEAVLPICGDGIVDSGEACDDGNTTSGDGCSATCQIEPPPSGACGDGMIDAGEGCDDGNNANGDGCSATCQVEPPPTGVCGDGILDAGEACDDGNTASGDGCSSACTMESFFPICGDGIVGMGEACDDGNTINGDGCSSTCQIEPPPTGLCGDGLVAPSELCDDGNVSSMDGCDSTCLIEIGWTCPTPGAPCEEVCGDAFVAGAEQCDDGNLVNMDGCSDTCTLETQCEPPPFIAPPIADLVVSCWTAPVGPWAAGSTQVINFEITNIGMAGAGMSEAGVYASNNSIIRPTDILIATVPVGALPAASASASSVSVTLPMTITPGTWYIGVIADIANAVPEHSEANNIRSLGPVVITP